MTPALWARLFVAAMAEVVRGFRFLGNSVGRSADFGPVAGAVVDAAEDREDFVAAFGLVIEVASS